MAAAMLIIQAEQEVEAAAAAALDQQATVKQDHPLENVVV
jgi:hypothetical protein